MKRKLLIFSVLFLLCINMITPVLAAKNTSDVNIIEISTAKELLVLAEECKTDYFSIGKVVELKADISLSEIEFDGIAYFDGTFHGNGYTISGVNIESEGSQKGFFRYIGELGEVSDLNVRGKVTPSGSQIEVGGIAGVNYGTIKNCTFMGNVFGQESVGGIVGVNKAFAKISGCTSKTNVVGTNRTGGIAGINEGTIDACVNDGKINTEVLDPVLEVEGMDMGDLNMASMLITRNNTGGIAGRSSGLITNCTNNGMVGYEHDGYNAGGIAGDQRGVIRDCTNYGTIYGRKDVGGIVGQAEPYVEEDYLSEKMNQMQNRMNRLERTMDHMTQTIENLPSDMGVTIDEEKRLEIEDMDLETRGQILKDKKNSMESDMNSLVNQMEGMKNQMNSLSSIEVGAQADISSVKNAQTFDGVISGCVNYGAVDGDINAAGIAGTMNIEDENDPENDDVFTMDVTLESRTNAVTISCVNYGNISGKKSGIGAVVGLQEYGLIYDCEGYGTLYSSTGSYMGGIAGKSAATIEKCYSVSDIEGSDYIGGIVGEGAKILNCLSITVIESDGESLGSIAGNLTTKEDVAVSVKGNYFVEFGHHGIDNISYRGMAEPKSFEEMMELAEIPERFKQVTVTFKAEDEIVGEMQVQYGDSLTLADFPQLENREDAYVEWPNEKEYSHITSNITLEAEYIPWVQSVSAQADAYEKPVFMLVDKFYEGTTLVITPIEETGLVLEEGETLLYAFDWEVTSEKNQVIDTAEGRFYRTQTEGMVEVWIKTDESWSLMECKEDGNYLVAEIPYGAEFAMIEIVEESTSNTYLMIGAAAILLLVIFLFIIHNKQKRKKN